VTALGVLFGVVGVPGAAASTIELLDDPDSDGTFVYYAAADGETNIFSLNGISMGRLIVQHSQT
jgi:hypothetical protein